MFVRRKRNRSGTTSVQIIEKRGRQNVVVKSVGCARTQESIELLEKQGRQLIAELNPQRSFSFLTTARDRLISEYLSSPAKPTITCIGPELVIGKIFDQIGFGKIPEHLFRDVVLSRLVYPVSKLKTVDYLAYHKRQEIDVSRLYRFLDRFYQRYKDEVERIAYNHTKTIVGEITIVFYDMTTLYFEAEDEDDLRKVGFSKDGKFQHPQIMLGLLVAENAYPIGYDIFEGNTFEGKTLLPIIEKIQAKYGFQNPIIVADSGLLSKENIESLKQLNYRFIIGARIKNETGAIRSSVISKSHALKDGDTFSLDKNSNERLVVGYSIKRAKKDAANRDKALKRLEASIKSGKLTKQHLSTRGYSKFLSLDSNVNISIDYKKIQEDKAWDGLKGYITNTELSNEETISCYQNLWHIEKAFRISKTDLRIRPIFHRKRKRIEAHICIAFAAYTVYKELERILAASNLGISAAKAINLTKTIYQIELTLPDSLLTVTTLNNLDPLQLALLNL